TEDTPGNAAILMKLLQDRGFQVLNIESSVTTFSSNHSTALVVSAKSYTGSLDRSQRERLKLDQPQLEEMRQEIIVYLGDQVFLHRDGSPAVKVRPFRTYRKLAEDVRTGLRFVLNRNGDLLMDSGVALTTRWLSHIARALGGGAITYAPAVDTKD